TRMIVYSKVVPESRQVVLNNEQSTEMEVEILSEISKATLTAILGTIDEGIHAVDAQGYTIYYNQFAAQHDGLKPGEVIGKHLLDIFPSLDVQTSTLLKAIETEEPIYNQHQRYTNIRGEQVVT